MSFEGFHISYQFVPYGTELDPQNNTLVLDVGLKTLPGVIDHHHPQAEAECTASLIAKSPSLVLDHIKRDKISFNQKSPIQIRFITHRFPDFDSISSIFLSLKLLEKGTIDSSMEKIARYTKLVDSASLPKKIDISLTPYSILRQLFKRIRQEEEETNLERVSEGLKFMNFLYSKLEEGHDIIQNRQLFSGVDRYERAIREAEDDYFSYLSDFDRSQQLILNLPLESGKECKKVDGLVVKNPKSFLLKEWASRDRLNPSLKEGFTFLMTNTWNKRYILGVDPERKVNLCGLGDLLNHKEAKKRESLEMPLNYRWYDGNCPFFNFRIIVSPQDVSILSHQEIVDTVVHFSQHNLNPG